MSDNSLEKQVKELMDGLEFTPDPAVWNKLEAELSPQKKGSRFFGRTAIVLLLLCGAGAGLFAWLYTSSQKVATEQSSVATNKILPPVADTALSAVPVTSGRGQAPVTPADIATDTSVPDIQDIHSHVNSIGGRQAVYPRRTFKAGSQHISFQGRAIFPKQRQSLLPLRSSDSRAEKQARAESGSATSFRQDAQLRLNFTPVDNMIAVQEAAEINTGNTFLASPTSSLQPAVTAPALISLKGISRRWQITPFVYSGIITHKGTGYDKTLEDKNMFASAVIPGGSGVPNFNSQQSVIDYVKSSTKSGQAFGAGALVEKQLTSKLSLQLGLRYQYISYDIKNFHMRDSISRMSNGGFATIPSFSTTTTDRYRLHYAGIPTLLRYNLSNPVDITAGVINDFALAANKNGESIGEEKRFWTPSAYFAFVVKVPGTGKHQWMIMPYVQYGLFSGTKMTGSQRMLQSGLSVALGLNK